jgi:hypothetical protein
MRGLEVDHLVGAHFRDESAHFRDESDVAQVAITSACTMSKPND